MLYRKRPDVVEANQWRPPLPCPGVRLEAEDETPVATVGGRGHGAQSYAQTPRHYVVTVHGQKTYVEPGDYIVREPTDPTRHYPVKADIFEARHDVLAADAVATSLTLADAEGDSLRITKILVGDRRVFLAVVCQGTTESRMLLDETQLTRLGLFASTLAALSPPAAGGQQP